MNTLHYSIRLMIYIHNYLSKAREWSGLGLYESTSTITLKTLEKGKWRGMSYNILSDWFSTPRKQNSWT